MSQSRINLFAWLQTRSLCMALGAMVIIAGAMPATAENPHPAVARIVVEEQGGTAYGSGVLIDAREAFGLVVTNWHVVRDATGPVQVVFSSGFRSQARALKLDKDWDLAALVIWRPPTSPAPLAKQPPRPGERLTICGYGQGDYRSATGRCTDYYAPKLGLPQELVELDVEARQGDSGGPIFNARGEVAGVLFGAGQGTTLGSFGGRVENFLASLAPGIGEQNAGPATPRTAIASLPPAPSEANLSKVASSKVATTTEPASSPWPSTATDRYAASSATVASPQEEFGLTPIDPTANQTGSRYSNWTPPAGSPGLDFGTPSAGPTGAAVASLPPLEPAPLAEASEGENAIALTSNYEAEPDLVLWFDYAKTTLAVIGVAFLFLQFVRLAT